MYRNYTALLALFLLVQISFAQAPRHKIAINDNWVFHQGNKAPGSKNHWQNVTLPHTWNTEDAFDDEKSYYRGIAWYWRTIDRADFPASDKVFLHFEGVNQVAEVYLNGQQVGRHEGGYTAFNFDITPFLSEGENQLMVSVDNSHNESIPPLRGDFTFYGGIYRDVYLLLTNDSHFEVQNLAAPGIFIRTPEVSREIAQVEVEGHIISASPEGSLEVFTRILDAAGETIAVNRSGQLNGKDKLAFRQELQVETPQLWSPSSPYLYRVVAELRQGDTVLDRIEQPLGIRWFNFDPERGFFLNGEHLKLTGVNRHQDYPGKGNALSNAEHLRDMRMIKEMGANFYRPAHYPQDPAVLEACDRLGLLVCMEIPLDHDQTNTDAFYNCSIEMQREMIRQYYNHPSIVIWAYMNEMFLGRNLERDREDIEQIVAFARVLEKVTREEDPTRWTMIPNHGDFKIYHESGLLEIPMIIGWNLYYGWYERDSLGFGAYVDHCHELYPGKPIVITEYGAGSDPRIRSEAPERFDFSIEWSTAFHQWHLPQIMARDFVAGTAVWNMFDFGSDNRQDAVPHVNNKGLVSYDRRPKDAFYLYQAWLTEEPVLHIATDGWPERDLVIDPLTGKATQLVQVYGNGTAAELIVNGHSLGSKTFEDHIAEWEVEWQEGVNYLEARATDQPMARAEINCHLISPEPYLQEDLISINFGTTFYFNEPASGTSWLPQTVFGKGMGTLAGGRRYQPLDRGIGSDRNIPITENDPLYQTQWQGLEEIMMELQPGAYRLTFHFSELERKAAGERQFAITINDETIFPMIDLAAEADRFQPLEKSVDIYLESTELQINFEALQGEAVLNAFQIQRR